MCYILNNLEVILLENEIKQAETKTLLANGKPHVSYSEMSTWMQCSYRHKLKHIDGIDLDSYGIETILGTAFHECVQARVNGHEPDQQKLRDIIQRDIDKVKDEDKKKDFSVEECMQRALVMSVEGIAFLDIQFPGWKLIQAEENLYEKMVLGEVNHEDASFKGFIDLIIEAPNKKGKMIVWIIDWKTAARPWDKRKIMDPKVTSQLSLYKNFWAAKHNRNHDEIRCGYIIALKKGKPGKICSFIPISVGPTSSRRVLTVLNNFVGSMKRKIAIKNKSESNCKYCEYKQTKWCP